MKRNFDCPYAEGDCVWSTSPNCLTNDPACIKRWREVNIYHTKQEGIYELHLTYIGIVPDTLAGWHHSAISNDPLLGNGTRFYLTSYAQTVEEAYTKLLDGMISRPDFVRAKIEYIVMDVRRHNE